MIDFLLDLNLNFMRFAYLQEVNFFLLKSYES